MPKKNIALVIPVKQLPITNTHSFQKLCFSNRSRTCLNGSGRTAIYYHSIPAFELGSILGF